MYKTFIVFFVLATTLLSTTYGYTDCGSKVGTVEDVAISNCDNNSGERCILKRNSNVSISISFKSGVDSDSLKSVVHGIVLGIETPFNLPNPNGCVDSGIECPVKKDGTYEYKTLLPVLGVYPRVTVDVKWELQDKDGQDYVCILIPSKIK